MIFFGRGAIETTKKLRWTPDIIHCHGWMTALVPLFIKNSYKDDPLFENAKVVYSMYSEEFNEELDAKIKKKLEYDGIKQNDMKALSPANFVNLQKLAVDYSDAVIEGNESINEEVRTYAKKTKKPYLEYKGQDEYIEEYNKFYNSILN